MDKPMGYLAILVGIPGSGKSTLSDTFRENGWTIMSSDAIRAEVNGDESIQLNSAQVFDILYGRARVALLYDENVVIDSCACQAWARKKAIDECGELASRIFAVVCDCPIEKALWRISCRERKVPENVVRKMYRAFVMYPPTTSEGFDAILSSDMALDLLNEGYL